MIHQHYTGFSTQVDDISKGIHVGKKINKKKLLLPYFAVPMASF